MKKIIIFGCAGCMALIGIIATFAAILLAPQSQRNVQKSLSIVSGSSRADIAESLQNAGIIRNAPLFLAASLIFYPTNTMKAGDYDFSSSQSFVEIADKLFRGVPKKEITITIIEGWDINDIASYLQAKGTVVEAEFRKALSEDYAYDFLPPIENRARRHRLEGYLFPDTYRIYEESTAHEIIDKMLFNFKMKIVEPYNDAIAMSGRSLDDIIILASIIEGEVQSDDDRARIADLLLRRLAAGMPLQVDSTVNYVTGKSSPSASYEDIAIDSPYNTYRMSGLPPGPISNPGESSIIAALKPEKNPYLFFLTTNDRRVIYSKTFDEHKLNKIRYLK